MSRPLSQLVYARIRDDAPSPRVITLHDHNQFARDVREYALAASPSGRIIGLESYKGVFSDRVIIGYTWFVGPLDRPSPLFFGDALAEIERFLHDEVDRQQGRAAELPFLLGVGQGAIMALAAAAAVPDLLSGVIAINGFLPVVPGWSPPLAPLEGLPILLVNAPPTHPHPATVLAGERLVETLQVWGGSVTLHEAAPDPIPGAALAEWLAHQPRRTIPHHAPTNDQAVIPSS